MNECETHQSEGDGGRSLMIKNPTAERLKKVSERWDCSFCRNSGKKDRLSVGARLDVSVRDRDDSR